MVRTSIRELEPAIERCVIINVSTKVFTTLALMGALKYARMPVLVVDCESTDGSYELFQDLLQKYEFDLVAAERLPHGRVLDLLFTHSTAERMLLVDSDLVFNGPSMVDDMKALMASPDTFGAGCVHSGSWFKTHPGRPDQPIATGIAWYLERGWMPFVMFRTEPVKQALERGISFIDRFIFNDLSFSHRLSFILWQRFKLGLFRNSRLSFLDPVRSVYDHQTPCYVFSDTGADVYQFLRYKSGKTFGAIPWSVAERSVWHFGGITRVMLEQENSIDAPSRDATLLAEKRLKSEYGIVF
ncbi:MAG: hypothetical protein DMG13_07650 [Acidobacteria bacterium]|nr:MAG: hypothetical protein DMG13_07650 [Acidobacteriota bacterium]